MYVELTSAPKGTKFKKWQALLSQAGLTPDEQTERTVLVWEDDELIATGSRQGNLLKCIAVDAMHQGMDLTSTLLTNLRQDAFSHGHKHLFLYTKPGNEYMFSSLFFYPIAKTGQVLLMESLRNGITEFLSQLPDGDSQDKIGAAVMNCNPFTKGHRYLIETAAKECDRLYVFVLSEDKSTFSAKDRMEMVKLGTADLSNVTVLPTGPYLISSATFPTYFLKEREKAEQIHCLLDIEIFCKYFVPKFKITHRFVGTEPLSQMTNQYNDALKAHLPEKGIVLREIPRLEESGTPVSASAVRSCLEKGELDKLKALVPTSTYKYLTENNLLIRKEI